MSTEPMPPAASSTRPMRVLMLGLCRTGTMSTQTALEILGYDKVYNYSVTVKTPGDPQKWIAALEAKFEGKGEVFGSEEWDEILGDYDAVRDIPTSCFAAELIAAYPDAKVILTIRSTESWFTSVNETIWAYNTSPLSRLQRLRYTPQLASAAKLMDTFFSLYFYGNYPKFGPRVYEEHNERVRALVPKENLLEFHPKNGWGPLCAFLGKDVPAEDFPKVNETRVWKEMFKSGKVWERAVTVGGLVGMGAMGVVVAGLAWKRFGGMK